jgi:tRNA(Ile)-lysidine synthase
MEATISATERAEAFAGFSRLSKLALAVSGGADSMALMVLVRAWLGERGAILPEVSVLTVDHQLRRGSRAEAEWVGEQADRLGFPHRILSWEGPKADAAIQESAREARYTLMAAFCREHGIPALATGHNLDDQAETLLMRLTRGSGLDGLAGMSARSRLWGLEIFRPLLAFPRARLEAHLRAQALSWIEDPSNEDIHFERVRLRKAMALAKGLGLKADKLALSATRLERARRALEQVAREHLRSCLTIHPAGYGELPREALFAVPCEIGLRMISLLARAFGGRPRPPRLARIESFYDGLRERATRPATIGGCLFSVVADGQLRVAREYGRLPMAPMSLPAGETRIWDGRFAITLPAQAPRDVYVRPLGPSGLEQLRQLGGEIRPIPRYVALSLPSLWRADALILLPHMHFAAPPRALWLDDVRIEFLGAQLIEEAEADHSRSGRGGQPSQK